MERKRVLWVDSTFSSSSMSKVLLFDLRDWIRQRHVLLDLEQREIISSVVLSSSGVKNTCVCPGSPPLITSRAVFSSLLCLLECFHRETQCLLSSGLKGLPSTTGIEMMMGIEDLLKWHKTWECSRERKGGSYSDAILMFPTSSHEDSDDDLLVNSTPSVHLP